MTFDRAEPFPYTLLSLPRYAKILGINPVHFAGGYGTTIFPLTNRCSDVWPRYSWQNSDQVSHMDLALEILNAEQEIAEQLGWWMAPRWIAQEAHMHPRFLRRDYYDSGSYNVRGQNKSIRTHYGKIIEPGQRSVDLVGTATVAAATLEYDDTNLDGFVDLATITLPTSYTDACKHKVYFLGSGGGEHWEIRPERAKEVAGGVFTATFDPWLFIDPDTLSAYPGEYAALLLDTDDYYVVAVEVYYEDNDPTDTSAVFYWEPQPLSTTLCAVCSGTGCSVCQLTEQEGCIHIRDATMGWVVPTPATYSDGWSSANWAVCRDPDQVKLYYYAGDLDNLNRRGVKCEPLSDFWAQTIAYLATARLERPFCTCGNSAALANHWMEDLSRAGDGVSYSMSFGALDNPFGTRRGEVMAWQRVSKIMAKYGQTGFGAI